MRSLLIAIGLLITAGLGYWAWQGWRTGSDLGPGEEESLVLEAEQDQAELIGNLVPSASTAERDPADEPQGERLSAEAQPTPSFPVEWSTHDPLGLLIQVVQGTDGRAVPGAQVSILSTERQQDPAVTVDLRHGGGVHATLDRFGLHYLTDVAGEVRAPLGTGSSVLRARLQRGAETWTAMRIVYGHEAPPYVLKLEPAKQFRVRVLRANGLPAHGAQPQLLAAIPMGDNPPTQSFLVHKDTTQRNGWATLENTVDQIAKGLPAHLNDSLIAFVGVYGIFQERLRWPVDWKNTTPAEIEVSLPATGSVVINALDAQGQRLTEGWIVLRAQDAQPGGNAWNRTEQMLRQDLHGAQGRAHFDWVEVGQNLVAEYYQSPGRATQRLEVRGPQTEGETVTVSFDTGEQNESFQGTLVDALGDPIAHQTVGVGEANWDARRGDGGLRQSFRTDELGRFSFAAAWLPRDANGERTMYFRWERPGEVNLAGEVQPPVGPPGKPTDLGEIALEVPPLIVAGRVLNPNGAPLVCSLVVYQPAQEASGRATGNRRERWRVRTDSSGYFAVNGHGSGLPVSFQLASESYELLESEAVPAGSSQVVLRTAYRSSLRFRMRGNAAEQGAELEARLVSVGPNGERDVRTSNWDRFGAVQIPKLIPGSYTLEIGQKTVPEVVFWSQTFEIQPGESMDLGDIPLDVELHTYTVEFVLAESVSDEEFRVAHGLALGAPVPARIHRTAGREYTLKSTQRLDQVEITQAEQPEYRRRFDVQPGANRLRVP